MTIDLENAFFVFNKKDAEKIYLEGNKSINYLSKAERERFAEITGKKNIREVVPLRKRMMQGKYNVLDFYYLMKATGQSPAEILSKNKHDTYIVSSIRRSGGRKRKVKNELKEVIDMAMGEEL